MNQLEEAMKKNIFNELNQILSTCLLTSTIPLCGGNVKRVVALELGREAGRGTHTHTQINLKIFHKVRRQVTVGWICFV